MVVVVVVVVVVVIDNKEFMSPWFYSNSSKNYLTNPFSTSFNPTNLVVFLVTKYLSYFRLLVNVGSNIILTINYNIVLKPKI